MLRFLDGDNGGGGGGRYSSSGLVLKEVLDSVDAVLLDGLESSDSNGLEGGRDERSGTTGFTSSSSSKQISGLVSCKVDAECR